MNDAATKRFMLKKLLLLSVLFPMLLLGAAELLCRWLADDPKPSPAKQTLFEESSDGRFLQVRPAYLSSFHDLKIRMPKPEGSLRILCLGGSSAYGFPFGIESAFPRWLELLLGKYHPECRAEVLNLGAMSYGSRRILAAMPEWLSLQPDGVLVYCGHNEFVEKAHAPVRRRAELPALLASSRLLQVFRGALKARRPSDQALTPEVYREAVHLASESERRATVSEFEKNYEAILRACVGAGVATLAATMPSNIRDWRPDGARRFGTGREDEWEAHYGRGKDRWAEAKHEEALGEFEAAAAIDPSHAMLQYLRGQCLLRLGRYPQAKEALETARDADASPQRAFRSINQAIRDASARVGVPCPDLVKVFESESEHELVGSDWIEDYVHPTVAGHQLIAAELYRALPELPPLPINERRSREEALKYLSSLEKPQPSGPARAAFHYNLGLKFINQGNWEKVVEANREAIRCDASHALAHNNLGRGLQELGRLDEALECYLEAARLRPNLAGIYRNLGSVYQARKQMKDAAAAYRRSLQLRPEDALVHYLLATALADQQLFDEAIAHYHEAIRLDPVYFEAHANLGLAYALSGEKEKARAQWEKALEIRPREAVVTGWLRELKSP